jgi:guanylate kinase
LERCVRAGRDILLDIDVQGARQIKKNCPEAVSIFLLPPSLRELKRRLAARGTDGKEIIRRRLANAQGEIGEIIHYDYFVVNREVKEAVRALSAIVEAERARISRVSEWRLEPLRRKAGRESHGQRNQNQRSGR